MQLFQHILSEVRTRLDLQSHARDDIALLVSEIVGVPITASNLSLKKGTLSITVLPTVKMAVMIKKDVILAACKERNYGISFIA